jgi:hypothetical protein
MSPALIQRVPPPKSVKSIRDCGYTAFISYAHADDTLCFGWIKQFKNELEQGLGAAVRGPRLPGMHLSGENGPVAGELSDELKERVAASFAMVIIVHDNYAQSEWCLRELEYFRELFGDEGFRERLYIVALSEPAILRVTEKPAWKRLMPAGGAQVWMPFFTPDNRSGPMNIYIGEGVVSPAFRSAFERLRAHFAEKVKAALAEQERPVRIEKAAVPSAPATAPTPAAVSADVVFGFVPPAAVTANEEAAASLIARGTPARAISQEAIFNQFAAFDGADDLVLALDDSLTTLAAGGHLPLQRDAWLAKGKALDRLHWLDLRSPGSAAGAAAVAALGAAPLPLPELLDRLAPRPTPAHESPKPRAHAVRIYIESNRHERDLWEPLGEQIQAKWEALTDALAPGRQPPLVMSTLGLPVDQLDKFPTLADADGVVLLWGNKSHESLVAQIRKVEDRLAAGRDTAPGIVAFLMPPQQSDEPLPAWGWRVLRFNAADEDHIDVVDDERDQLDRFLRKVFKRHQQRTQGP